MTSTRRSCLWLFWSLVGIGWIVGNAADDPLRELDDRSSERPAYAASESSHQVPARQLARLVLADDLTAHDVSGFPPSAGRKPVPLPTAAAASDLAVPFGEHLPGSTRTGTPLPARGPPLQIG